VNYAELIKYLDAQICGLAMQKAHGENVEDTLLNHMKERIRLSNIYNEELQNESQAT
jgi:hypothetical protein